MAEATNGREFTRAKVGIKVDVSTSDGYSAKGVVSDLSLKGVFFLCYEEANREAVHEGAACSVTLSLDASDPPILVETDGKVTRVEDEALAVEFDAVEADSFEHLHNLVLANSQDADQVEDEFEHHVGIKRRRSSDFR